MPKVKQSWQRIMGVCPWEMQKTWVPSRKRRAPQRKGGKGFPPACRNPSSTSPTEEGSHFVPISVSRQETVMLRAWPLPIEDIAAPEGCRETHWGGKWGLRPSCQRLSQRIRGSSDAAEQWRGQAVHNHFMTQTSQGQEIQVATWPGHELQHKWIVLTNQLWSIKPNKTCYIA